MARAMHLAERFPTTSAGWGLFVLALLVAAGVLTVIPALTAAWRLGGHLLTDDAPTAAGHDTNPAEEASRG